MKSNFLLKATAFAAIALGATAAGAQTYSFDAPAAGSLAGVIPQTLAQYTAKDGVTLQVVTDQTLARSLINLAAGKLDMAVVVPTGLESLRNAAEPYKDLGDNGKAMAANVRSLFGIPGGTYHAIVWADSGINSWADAKGKRVFIGPAGGAANDIFIGLAQIAGGIKVDEDFEPVRAPWAASSQSFQDGQFDVLIASAAIGQKSLMELSLQRPIRLLGVDPAIADSDGYRTYLKNLSLMKAVIPAGTYPGQVNSDQDVITAQTVLMIGVTKDFSEEDAYKITRAYWQNLDDMKAENALLKPIDASDPFAGLNAPLHPGAIRYYEEAGIAVPAELKP